METTLRLALFAHVGLGFIGLTAFWVPLLSRKGGAAHRTFGKIFKYCAYVVVGTAGAAVVLRVTLYLIAGHTPVTRPSAFAGLVFLGYLALVSFVTVRHGVGVLEHKKDPAALATPVTLWLARGAMAASVVIILYALVLSPPNRLVLYSLSPIGLLTGRGILRYVSRPPAGRQAWLYEHLGSMIASGIAFHTAFAVFGVSRIVSLGLEGWVAVVPWIAPAAIGIPAIVIWTNYYRRKYGEAA